MNREKHISEYNVIENMKGAQSSQIFKQLIEYRAQEKDSAIINNLLKKLVASYAITERKLAEMNELKNKFLGMAAHDLRNPLTSIRGFCEIYLDEDSGLDAELTEIFTIIHEASEHMLTLVNDLLDVSVIESGKMKLTFTRGPLREVLEKRIHLITLIAQKKDIVVHTSFHDVPDILFDPERITQVIDNLMSNAIKFSPPGSTIYFTLEKTGDAITFSVRDEGPGISPEDQTKLFGEFQKLTARPTGGESSTGLGLMIVKKIIEAHQGTISVESTPGSGSTFTVSLPLVV